MSLEAKDNILLPVEIQHREFDGKLLLACEIAERGKGAIIGSRVDIHKQIARLPFGLYHAKDALLSSCRILGIIRDRGRIITLLDEEAAVYHTPENYRERRLHGCSLDMVDQIYAWGEDSKQLIDGYSEYKGQPISSSGNPRMDLLRPELRDIFACEAELLRKKYGNFLLINTNFGKVNHFVKTLSLDVTSKQNTGSDFMKGSHVHRHKVYKAFRKMLPQLAEELRDVPIILRPHPSENQETWHSLLKPFENVKILYEGNVIPWLLASKATLHNGCTTAVESFLLDKMAFCYEPFEGCDYDLALPNRLSQEYMNIEKMISAIKRQLISGTYRKPSEKQKRLASHHFANLEGNLAAEKLAAELIFCLEGTDKSKQTSALKKSIAFFHAEGRALVKRINALNSQHKNSAIYTNHRFPGVSLDMVEKKVAAYGRLLKRFRSIEVTQLDRHIFHLSKK